MHQSQSEPELVQFVRKAGADAASEASGGGRRHGTGRSDARYERYDARYTGSQRSSASRLSRSRGSRSAASSGSIVGLTLREQQSNVENQALERYKRELEKDAREERRQNVLWETKVQSNMDDEKMEANLRKMREARNQGELLAQIERNKVKRQHDRKEHIEIASLHAYPLFSETFISQEKVDAIRKAQKDQWREDLKMQMATQEMLKNLEEVQYREQVTNTKNKHLLSMKRERGQEQDRLRRQGRELVSAWDKELQLKEFRKAIIAGKEDKNVPHTPGSPYA